MPSGFRINKEYAEKYDKWRQKEELQKLKDKYGDVDEIDESDSSSSESEDEDAEALTAQVEKDWLRTLAALKRDDPKIYEKDTKFYHSDDEKDEEDTEGTSKKKEKALYIKDYDRKVMLEKDGQLSSESEDSDSELFTAAPGYYEEQEEIKKSFKSALSDSECSDSELFSKKQKTSKEEEEEEEEYWQWLKGHKQELESTEEKVGIELEPLKDYWNNPELDNDEKFLRDYFLNKDYKDQVSGRIPSYDEIVNDVEDISDEEEMLEKQEKFERKYNFRFEEPDQEFIKSYPRTIKDSVRMKDNKRSEKRLETRERKALEKEKKKEEIKQLKNLKKQEIMDKIEKLKQITGNATLGFSTEDIDEDFDPKKHDDMMQKYFDKEYYGMEEEDKKPEFSDDDEDLQIENWDTWEGGYEDEVNEEAADDGSQDDLHCDDAGFIMDADYDPSQALTKKKKKKNKKSKFAQAVTQPKPVFDPEEKSFEQYFEEYYKLDYEDIIDDMPCRFKYRKVMPNCYGLSVNEVLGCKDKELNQWVSLKKMSQYKTREEEDMDMKIYAQKGKNWKKKRNVLLSLKEKKEEEDDKKQKQEEKKAEARRKKRQRRKQKRAQMAGSVSKLESDDETDEEPDKKKSKTDNMMDVDSSVSIQNDVKDVSEQKKKAKTNFMSSDSDKDFENQLSVSPMSSKESFSPKKKVKQDEKDFKCLIEGDTLQQIGNSKECSSPTKTKVKQGKSQDLEQLTQGDNSRQNVVVETKGSVKTTPIDNKNIDSSTTETKKKRKKKKKKVNATETIAKQTQLSKVEKRNLKKRKGSKPILTDERLLAYGIQPKKFRYMKFAKRGDK